MPETPTHIHQVWLACALTCARTRAHTRRGATFATFAPPHPTLAAPVALRYSAPVLRAGDARGGRRGGERRRRRVPSRALFALVETSPIRTVKGCRAGMGPARRFGQKTSGYNRMAGNYR
jgi:hypothetical protein